MKIKQAKGDRVVLPIIYTILFFCAAATLYPFLNIVAKAFSGYTANTTGSVSIWPVDFQVDTLLGVIQNKRFLQSFWISVQVSVLGTLLSIFISGMAAYVLSRRQLRGRRGLTLLFVFTMMFSGGMVPQYMLLHSLGMLNHIASLFVPGAVSVYNMLILKSAFEEISPALEESAKLDGAGNMTIFLKIMLPIVKPSFAAVALFLAVGYWNEYWSAMLYITKSHLKPLQIYLMDVINASMDTLGNMDSAMLATDSPEGVKAATILISMVPVLIVYPLLQKHFAKGVMIGSVKE